MPGQKRPDHAPNRFFIIDNQDANRSHESTGVFFKTFRNDVPELVPNYVIQVKALK